MSMAATVEFYFFYGSIHSYLTVMRIDALAAGAQIEVRWQRPEESIEPQLR